MKKTTSILVLFALLLASCKTSQRPDLADGIYANIKTAQGRDCSETRSRKNTRYSGQLCVISRGEPILL
jgi:hypothetical protein